MAAEDWDGIARRGIFLYPQVWGADATGTGGGEDIFQIPEVVNGNPQVFAFWPHAASLALRGQKATANAEPRKASTRNRAVHVPGWEPARGRLVIDTPELEARIEKMGIKDKKKIYTAKDLAPGKHIVFAATGVTDGALMKGVRFFGEGTRTSSIVMTRHSGKVRFVESIHLAKRADVKVRFA